MASLGDKLAQALGADVIGPGDSIDELAEQFGDTTRQQNAGMAAALAGTADKTSKAYKAKLRSVQRWRKGTRKPSRGSLRQLGGISPRRGGPHVDRMRRRGAAVTINGQFDVKTGARGKKRRDRRTGPRKVTTQLSAGELEPVLDAWERREDQEAASALIDALDTYFAGQGNLEIHNVLSLEITPR